MSADTLRRAADIVRERGLGKMRYESPDGRVCAEGAIAVAAGGVATPTRLPNAAFGEFARCAQTLQRHIGYRQVTLWNDEPERTADDVIAALEAAAARLEATT